MKGEIVLTDEKIFDNEFLAYESNYGFGLSIYIDEKNTLEKQLLKKEMIINEIDCTIKSLLDYDEDRTDEINIHNNLKENIDHIIENAEFIRFDHDLDIKKFIKNNPIIKDKKIVIDEVIDIVDYEKVIKLLEFYSEYKNQIYVNMHNNTGYVSLENCLNTINKIRKEANQILALNLSPMETIMYAYDYVRNREYKHEDEGESALESRDLCSVMTGDKIVCVGYSNMFNALLNYMNIRCFNVGLTIKNSDKGHERNVIYVQDEKYNIDGVYYFDATWDRKLENETNEFLNRYSFFAKTREEMSEIEANYYTYDECPYYSKNMVSDIQKLLDEENLELLNLEYAKSLNYMSFIINGIPLIKRECLLHFLSTYNQFDRKDLLNRLKNIEDKLNKPISAETFIKLLNNVRKIQYYQNSEFYPYSINSIYETYIRSNWKFAEHHYKSEEKLLALIFGIPEAELNEKRDAKFEDFRTYVNEEDILRDVSGVQLTKKLRTYYESRK